MQSFPLRRAVVGLAFALSLDTTTSAFGQTSKGIIAGVARDVTGAAVSHATVTVTNQGTSEKRTLQTGADGAYRIEAISPGQYTIIVTDAGFSTSEVKDVTVTASSVTSYDVTLQVGTTATEVTVEANQGAVDADNGVLSGIVDAVQLDKLPVFTLNPVELALTVPGVQPVQNGSGGSGAFSNGVDIQVNGARPRDNNFLVDGQEINDVTIAGQAFQPTIPDIFESVAVITNSAPAEYGRGSGGIVNLVTKSGTNSFHGTAYERYTGSGLNSLQGFQRGSGEQVTRFDLHTFGFTAGGPIIKNKLFAFGAWQLQRYYGQETAGVNLLPDAGGYQTLQSITGAPAAQVALLDQYLSGGAYLAVDQKFASASGTPITQNVGALPGCPATGCVISFAGFERPNAPESSPDTQWTYKIDFRPEDRDVFSFRYIHDRSSLSPDFGNNGNALAGFDTQVGGPVELAEGQYTHIFSPSILNEFRVSEARLAFLFSPEAATTANPLNALPTFTFLKLNGTTTAGSVAFPSLGPNQNFPQGRKEDLYQFQDTVRYTRGRQSFSFGADIGRLLEIDVVSQNAIGTLDFASGGSGVSSFGNFLQNQLGPSGTATKTFGPTRDDSHGYRSGIFAQDDVKLSTDLTVNLGVRYDYLTNPENSLKFPGLDPNNPYAPINTVIPVKNDYNNIAPRIGFAYSPHGVLGLLGDGKTSIRGGFGIFYDSTFSNILINSTQSSPNSVAGLLIQTTGSGLANATSLIPTISPVLNPLSSVLSENSNLVNPLTYQYNLGVERELPGTIVLGVRYVGDRGEKEFANQQFNYFSGLTGQRLDPSRGAISSRGNYADSNYNSVQVTGTHNFKHGLLVNANYVYSKDLDDGSEIFTISGSSPTSYSANLAPGGRGQDYGNSAFDHRQFFSVAYVYTIPGVHSSNHFLDLAENLLTRHWTVSGITQLQSGAYSTFNTNGLDLNGDGSTSNDRPILGNARAPLTTVGIDGAFLGGTPGAYYDLGANNLTNALNPVTPDQVHFLVPYFPNNQYLHAEIGRNSFQQPGFTTNNISLEKGFDFKERGNLILRAEAQNIANHNDTTFGDTDVLDLNEGYLTPSRPNGNRNLVLWAKFEF